MAENNANPEPTGEQAPPAEATSEPVKEMRAIVLNGFGGIKQAQMKKVPEVKPKEGEVLIRVKACGLNFTDLMVRQGVMENLPKTPFLMGFECSGEVEAIGENVDNFAPGDRVVGIVDMQAWAELVCIPAQFVYHMPSGMSFQDGAALLMNYLTAHLLLFDIGNLRNGQSVLVHSVGGGVGHAVCQLCKTMENVTVFGTASYNKHEDIKNNLDHLYDHVVDYCQEVRKVSPEGVDLVLDCLCGEDTNRGISLLKPLGRYILYGSSNIVTGETKSFFSFAKSKAFQFGQHLPEKINATKWWQVDKISPIKLFDENKTVSGFSLRTLLFRQGRHELARDIVHKLFQMYNDGKIRPKIDSAWAFEDVGDAMQKMHDKKNVGKVLLDPSLPSKSKADGEAPNPDAAPANGGKNGKE